MIRRGDENQRVFGEGLGDRFQFLRRPPHDGEVDVVVGQLLDDLATVVHAEAQFDFRVMPAEGREQARREILRGGHHADVQPPAAQALHGGERFLGLAQLLGDDAGVARQFLAGLGEEDALADLLGERQPGRFFQAAHLHGDGGLGQVQFVGGARERQVARHRLENLQLAQGQVHDWSVHKEQYKNTITNI